MEEEEALVILFDKMEAVQHHLSVGSKGDEDMDKFLTVLANRMEDFYEEVMKLRGNQEIPEQALKIIQKELVSLAKIYTDMNKGKGESRSLVEDFHDHVFQILRAIGQTLRGEDLQTVDEEKGTETAEAGGLNQLNFPTDLFTAKRVDFSGLGVPANEKTLNFTSFFDGLLALSKEADIGFIRTCLNNITWSRNSMAMWTPAADLKGLDIPVWSNGLPCFHVAVISLGTVWATFLPVNVPSEEENTTGTLAYFKQLYNFLMDIIVPKAITNMSPTSRIRIHNHLLEEEHNCKYLLTGSELHAFGDCMKSQISAARRNNFPSDISFHFILREFGQDYPLTGEAMAKIQDSFNLERTSQLLVHLATNISQPGKTLFWDKTYIDRLFHAHGSTYYSCGFNQLLNGQGPVSHKIHRKCRLHEGIIYMKMYNTMFKRFRHALQQRKQGFTEVQFFDHPVLSTLLATQPHGIKQAVRGNPTFGFLYKCMEQKLHLKILHQRLNDLPILEGYHDARVEFVCSLKDQPINVYVEQYTGRAVLQKLEAFSNVVDVSNPVIILDKPVLSTYLQNLLRTLATPIAIALIRFFDQKRPVTPDMIETVHACESIISFILYGTKNYLPAMSRLGLDGNHFRHVNRVTLAYAVLTRQGIAFLIDSSQNRIGSIFMLHRPSNTTSITVDTFTEQMVQINTRLKLDKFSIACYVLAFFMTELRDIGQSRSASFRNHNPLTIFTRAFVTSAQDITVLRRRVSVSEFVHCIINLKPQTFQTYHAVEMGMEILGDMDDDNSPTTGSQLLTGALKTVCHLSLKGKLNLKLELVPVVAPTLNICYFQHIVADFSELIISVSPLVLHRKLVVDILSNVGRLLAKSNPFSRGVGIPQVPDLYLLYKTVTSGNVNITHALTVLGCAIAFRLGVDRAILTHFMKNNGISFRTLSQFGLCNRISGTTFTPVSNETFRCELKDSFTYTEKEFFVSYNNMMGAGLYPL